MANKKSNSQSTNNSQPTIESAQEALPLRLTRRSFFGAGLGAALAFAALPLAGCGSSSSGSGAGSASTGSADSREKDSAGLVELKAVADLTPHQEILNYAEPALEDAGIKVNIVSNDTDTANNKVESGEVDFNYFQHEPYLNEWNTQNGGDLVNLGGIHVEPITAYSDKYSSTDEVPDDATVAIPSDATNEYRALRILEENGFIKLDDEANTELGASTQNISDYVKPIKIVEIDSAQIIPTKDDYDFFITNTNKALEAKITSNKLFSESGQDNPYANIIAVKGNDENDKYLKKLVEVLLSDDVQKWIQDNYNGAVIPVKSV